MRSKCIVPLKSAMIAALITITSFSLSAQDASKVREKLSFKLTADQLSTRAPIAKPEDVSSPRALVLALHAAVTGRLDTMNWHRLRSLFLPTGLIGEAGSESAEQPTEAKESTTGQPYVQFQQIDEWLHALPKIEPGTTNDEVIYKIRIEQYGNIASAFYSHSAVLTVNGQTDDVRRVNSCQMVFDGKRWWISSVLFNVSPKKWDLPKDMKP